MASGRENVSWWSRVITLIVTVVVVAGLWLATTAAYENIRISRGTDQILSVIANARDMAIGGNFQAGDDLLQRLARAGRLTDINGANPSYVLNTWQMPITAKVLSANQARFELTLPTPICRRLAAFFSKDAIALGIQEIEGRVSGSPWQKIHEIVDVKKLVEPSSATIYRGCGEEQQVMLALVLQLR